MVLIVILVPTQEQRVLLAARTRSIGKTTLVLAQRATQLHSTHTLALLATLIRTAVTLAHHQVNMSRLRYQIPRLVRISAYRTVGMNFTLAT